MNRYGFSSRTDDEAQMYRRMSVRCVYVYKRKRQKMKEWTVVK